MPKLVLGKKSQIFGMFTDDSEDDNIKAYLSAKFGIPADKLNIDIEVMSQWSPNKV